MQRGVRELSRKSGEGCSDTSVTDNEAMSEAHLSSSAELLPAVSQGCVSYNAYSHVDAPSRASCVALGRLHDGAYHADKAWLPSTRAQSSTHCIVCMSKKHDNPCKPLSL